MVLEEIFAEVLRLSFYGTVGCGVILVCVLINYTRAPRWISMILWGLVALRLVIPFSVPSTISLLQFQNIANLSRQLENTLNAERSYRENFKTAQEKYTEYEQTIADKKPVISNTNDNPSYNYKNINEGTKPIKTTYEQFLFIGARIWLTGMLFLWSWAVFSYARLKYRLRFSMRIYNGVYETDVIASPCVVGFIKPQIYLIPGLTDQQKTHILLHEQMHIRYLDPIWKAVSFLILSVHWFNPFLWLMYKVFQGELEKACDERVLIRLGGDKKADYSESLLALSASKDWNQKQKWKFPTPNAFGENNIKGRIKQILSYKKPLAAVSFLVVLISIISCGIFLTAPKNILPADSDTDTNASVQGESIVNTEIYEEFEDNDILYQAGNHGIFRRHITDVDTEQIYPEFAGTNLLMTVFEGKLYFKTDKNYTANALDWADNAICWIDLETLDTGSLPMVRENALISDFCIYDGIIEISYSYPETVDTFMLYVDETITQLSESELQQHGLNLTQSLLQNPGTLINISNRTSRQNIAYLDMDNNGILEKITLAPSSAPDRKFYQREHDPLAYYHLQIDNAALEGFGDNVANTLWAVSLDGQKILLVLYEDGPSWDPYTHFFQYQNGKIMEIGGFEDDIRLCEISADGIITTAIRKEIVQTDWITVRWHLGQSGKLEEILQDVYDFKSDNWVVLNASLPLHPAVGDLETFVVEPQNVKFLQTSADWNWVLLETADGQQGWIHLDNYNVIELQQNVMDVFDGLYLAG